MTNPQRRIDTLQRKIAAMLNRGARTEIQFKDPVQDTEVKRALIAAELALSDAYWRAATNGKG